jgi:hypothetical protein
MVAVIAVVTDVAVVTAVAAVAHPVGVVTTRQQQASRILLNEQREFYYCRKQLDKNKEGNGLIAMIGLSGFKGSLTRDFRLQVFFMNQCLPGP